MPCILKLVSDKLQYIITNQAIHRNRTNNYLITKNLLVYIKKKVALTYNYKPVLGAQFLARKDLYSPHKLNENQMKTK